MEFDLKKWDGTYFDSVLLLGQNLGKKVNLMVPIDGLNTHYWVLKGKESQSHCALW